MGERLAYAACRTLGRLLRSVRYSKARLVSEGGELRVRKRRALHAPLLIWLSGPLISVLDAGVRFLPQREWEEREQLLYRSLHATSIRVDPGGVLDLPCLPGQTLAALLEDKAIAVPARRRAIELAAVALAELHRLGFTHADAMAENVLIDLEAGVARWFDFETVHEAGRPMDWRRADDLRALLATCALRTSSEEVEETLKHLLDAYGDDEVVRLLEASFTSAWRRSLVYHHSQAALSWDRFREIGRLLRSPRGR